MLAGRAVPPIAGQGNKTENPAGGRIPDLADSLVGLLHFPGLGPSASWLPVSSELPVPHGVTPTLLPLVRAVQDQYMTEHQRVNALRQDQSNQWLQLLRNHAQQDRPVTIWECTLHHDAVQHKARSLFWASALLLALLCFSTWDIHAGGIVHSCAAICGQLKSRCLQNSLCLCSLTGFAAGSSACTRIGLITL